MDPNELLKALRELSIDISVHGFNNHRLDPIDAALQMSALFHNLDEWIVKGGFIPNDWTLTREAS